MTEIKWEDPPPKVRAPSTLKGNGKAQLFAAELRKHPNRWALYATKANKKNAYSAAHGLRRNSGLEAVARGLAVYARWVEPEPTP